MQVGDSSHWLFSALAFCADNDVTFILRSDGNWLEYDELRAYEDDKEEASNSNRSRKHKKQGRRRGGKPKLPKKYLVPPMQYVIALSRHASCAARA